MSDRHKKASYIALAYRSIPFLRSSMSFSYSTNSLESSVLPSLKKRSPVHCLKADQMDTAVSQESSYLTELINLNETSRIIRKWHCVCSASTCLLSISLHIECPLL